LGAKRCQCNLCGKAYPRANALNHLKSHTKEAVKQNLHLNFRAQFQYSFFFYTVKVTIIFIWRKVKKSSTNWSSKPFLSLFLIAWSPSGGLQIVQLSFLEDSSSFAFNFLARFFAHLVLILPSPFSFLAKNATKIHLSLSHNNKEKIMCETHLILQAPYLYRIILIQILVLLLTIA